MPNATEVKTDTSKDRMVTIYLACLGAVGVGVLIAAALLGWGFWGYFGGGFLVVAGFGGLAGKLKEGGFAVAPCPGCGEELKFQFAKKERIMKCPACGMWSMGTETMAPVPDETVAQYPVFTTALPPHDVGWPVTESGEARCSMCERPGEFIKVEGADPMGTMGAMILPVSVRTVHSMMVPLCADHKDGTALLVSGSTSALGFRSRAYQLEFEAINNEDGASQDA